MKWFSNHNDLVGFDLNNSRFSRRLNQSNKDQLKLPPGFSKFIIVGIFFLLVVVVWLGWGWYNKGIERDIVRLNNINQLIDSLQKHQRQFAVFPVEKNWPELFNKLAWPNLIQDPLPTKFYFYCPIENGYVVGVNLERAPVVMSQKNLAQGLALNSCLTSNGITLKSLTCSSPQAKGEINGKKSWIWCAGNL